VQPGHWTVGALLSQTWGVGGKRNEAYLNSLTFQPVLAYAFPHGWTLTNSSPWTANWSAHGERWTIPVGLQVNKLIKPPHAYPMQVSLGVFDNVVRPPGQPDWFLRLQVQFVLPPIRTKPLFGG
jgi:hypothetical protein